MANKPVLHRRDHEHGGADTVRIVYESVGGGGAGSGGDGFGIQLNGPFTPADGETAFNFEDGDLGAGTPYFSGVTGSSFAVASGVASILLPGFYACTLFVKVEHDGVPSSDERFTIELGFGGGEGESLDTSGGTPTPSTPMCTVTCPAGTSDSLEANLVRTRMVSLTGAASFPVELVPFLRVTTPGLMVFSTVSLWGYRVCGDLGPDVSD